MGFIKIWEKILVRNVFFQQINEKAPLEKVCLIGCAIATGYGAALNTAKVIRNGSY